MDQREAIALGVDDRMIGADLHAAVHSAQPSRTRAPGRLGRWIAGPVCLTAAAVITHLTPDEQMQTPGRLLQRGT